MTPDASASTRDDESSTTALGVVLTLLMMAAWFGFIGLGAFAPAVLAEPVFAGGVTTIAFAYGLFVIALGVVLTTFYVWFTNRRAD